MRDGGSRVRGANDEADERSAVKAILLIDHGSRRDEANEMLDCMAALVQRMAGRDVVVRYAHMELAEPSIARGVEACVAAGATEIIAFPYMLSPGRHSTADIPRLVAQATRPHAGVTVRVTPAFGVESELGEVILRRAGIAVGDTLQSADSGQCWHPDGRAGACGDACPARASDVTGADPDTRTIPRSQATPPAGAVRSR